LFFHVTRNLLQQTVAKKKPAAKSDGPTGNAQPESVWTALRGSPRGRDPYLCSSAEFEMAWPPFEISWPAPDMVLQPARAAVPAISNKAMSRVMSVPLAVGDAGAERPRIVVEFALRVAPSILSEPS
jgi:hypothetical protein